MCLHLGNTLTLSPFTYSSKHIAQLSTSTTALEQDADSPYMWTGICFSSPSTKLVGFSSEERFDRQKHSKSRQMMRPRLITTTM
ncbi:hypothetical protein V6N13_072113 [Hibiscus sabdariffa]|uniref:Uncharacterized protein n=1 Tax=Hibiscus sabdariffa TaxID=183260 RepID=A0ABR2TCA3_9ROSI